MEKNMSSLLKNTDWFEELDYAPDNKIVEVLDEDSDTDTEVFLRDIGYNSDTTDIDSFAIWADL